MHDRKRTHASARRSIDTGETGPDTSGPALESVLVQELRICVGMLAGAWTLADRTGQIADQVHWVHEVARRRARDIRDGCSDLAALSAGRSSRLCDIAARVELLAESAPDRRDSGDRRRQFQRIRAVGLALSRLESPTNWGCR